MGVKIHAFLKLALGGGVLLASCSNHVTDCEKPRVLVLLETRLKPPV